MDRKAQVWIETVLYTVIILAIIAIVLSFALPKINSNKEKVIIEQSIEALKNLDRSINDAARQSGNQRIVEFSLKVGELTFDARDDREKISLKIDNLENLYSENGREIQNGNVVIVSNEGLNTNDITITLDYSGKLDIQYEGREEEVKINSADAPYSFSIENTNGIINITEA